MFEIWCQANAAGIDVGAREMFVAVPPGRDKNPVRVFRTFTEELERLAHWLVQCVSEGLLARPDSEVDLENIASTPATLVQRRSKKADGRMVGGERVFHQLAPYQLFPW